jgi:anhydro-N-acetylmuramic acid kinase
MDSVDGAVVQFSEQPPGIRLLATHTRPYPPDLRERLEEALVAPLTAMQWSRLDADIGAAFAETASELMAAVPEAIEVGAIACHGQTIWHEPDGAARNSIQLGDPHRVAAATGRIVVADLRRNDLAHGGQGAPLASGFHAWAFSPGPAVILNLGGIANLTALCGTNAPPRAWDIGPANTLMDRWINRVRGLPYDDAGLWAASGQPSCALLETLLAEPWLQRPPPRSTGRELFNLEWLRSRAGTLLQELAPEDVQRSLLALTVETCAREIEGLLPEGCEVHVCGGGTGNRFLMQQLQERMPKHRVRASDEAGIPARWMECTAFAWLARERLEGRPGNLRSVTGARAGCLLGALIEPPQG